MLSSDLDDTHLCIKCSSTIVGLENYIKHRKNNCRHNHTQSLRIQKTSNTNISSPANDTDRHNIIADDSDITQTPRNHLDHTYDSFSYHEPEAPTTYVNKNQHGGKTTKSLTDAYELPYELGADVFFSSLQLQSVQSTGPSTSGKTSSTAAQTSTLQRQKAFPQEGGKVGWMSHHAFGEIGDEKQTFEHVFKPLNFTHDSPNLTEDEDDEEEDDEDEEFDAIAEAAQSTSGKWKSSPIMRHSPPVVPATHTGGKWRPGNRPQLRATPPQISRLSPNWDDGQLEDVETLDAPESQHQNHPPAEHTKGKWIPGTKLQRLEYKEVAVLAKTAREDYWCKICGRGLKNKSNYESHLKTAYHLKRAEPEQQLEKASLAQLKSVDISKIFEEKDNSEKPSTSKQSLLKKRSRRAKFIMCELCKHVTPSHLIGKHLISHYHYRRMHVDLGKSLRMVLDNIHSIVLQSPFQCQPCRFYANTEEEFLRHWNSPQHLDQSEGSGKFFCSYCQYECEDNNQMRRHLLSSEHKEVILAINRSVPICISKRLNIKCNKCRQSFRYNAELRRHIRLNHTGEEIGGTASDVYQSRHKCSICGECCRSQVALQRHEKFKHSVLKFFCSICKLQFGTPFQARKHRKTNEHRRQAALSMRALIKKKNVIQRNCTRCSFVAKSDVDAVLHQLSHSTGEPMQMIFNSHEPKKKLVKIKKHRKQNTSPRVIAPIKCRDCEKTFTTETDLKQHRKTEHAPLNHLCTCCGETFISPQALGRHSRVCRPTKQLTSPVDGAQDEDKIEVDKNWICNQCNFSTSYESELIFHRLHHTLGQLRKNQVIKCPLCPKSFRKHSLRCHLRQHTNEKIFECEFCKLKFSRRHNLKDHINRLHKSTESNDNDANPTSQDGANEFEEQSKTVERQRYKCEKCNKGFSTKYTFQSHQMNKHGNGNRELACTFDGCQYAGINLKALKVHLISHSEENLQCDHPGCSYVGKSVMHLLRHRRSYMSPTKLFACAHCDFKARIKGHIRRHMRVHDGDKPHQCPHCDFKCSTLDNLRKHILKTKKHPGKFIYECQKCEEQREIDEIIQVDCKNIVFKTNSFQEMQKHLATAHN